MACFFGAIGLLVCWKTTKLAGQPIHWLVSQTKIFASFVYLVILRILGFFSSSFRKMHHPWLQIIAPPISQGSSVFFNKSSARFSNYSSIWQTGRWFINHLRFSNNFPPTHFQTIHQHIWSSCWDDVFFGMNSKKWNFKTRFLSVRWLFYSKLYLHPGKLTWQWNTNHLKMYLLL